ncbi:MAG: hypothetical protein Kow0077_26700 [Anaerolineae bacterium]
MHLDLLQVLSHTWDELCAAYDVSGDLPDMHVLFDPADLTAREQAERALVCMLSEVMERTGRFSPWYREPAETFGMVLAVDPAGSARWQLSPEAWTRWQPCLELLMAALKKNQVLLQAAHVVDDLDRAALVDDRYVILKCQCAPPSMIRIERALVHTQIVCAVCKQQFVALPAA